MERYSLKANCKSVENPMLLYINYICFDLIQSAIKPKFIMLICVLNLETAVLIFLTHNQGEIRESQGGKKIIITAWPNVFVN